MILPILCALALVGPPPVAAASGDPDLRALSSEVDALFRAWDRADSPGAAVLVIRDGVIVHSRGYGMANLEHEVPIEPTSVFDIASISKQFAGMAIAMLVEEGTLTLDDDVRDHVPELPDFGHTIRIRHLVHHTSGLRDWPGTLMMAGWDFMDVISFDQILEMAFHQRELNFPPGEEYAYSNTGYNLLAKIVSRATGVTFREWTEANIFAPLGMRQTHFHDDHTEVVPNRADSYRPDGSGGFRRAVSSLTALGSSSLFTAVEDLALWVANFDDPSVGGSGVVERMHRRGVLNGGDTIPYAYGVFVDEYRGATTVSHGGSWAGYRTMLLRVPEHRFAVVILANSSDVGPGPLGYRIADLYLDDRLEPESAGESSGPSDPGEARAEPYRPGAAALTAYEGAYRSEELDTSYRLRVDGDELIAEHFRTGRRTFRPVEPDVFQAPGFGRIEFQRDGEGRVTGFTANSVRIRGLRFERVR